MRADSLSRLGVLSVLVVGGHGASAVADMAQASLSGFSDSGSPVSALIELAWDGVNLTATVSNTSLDNSVITGFGLMGGTPSGSAGDFSATGTLSDSVWFAGTNLFLAPPHTFGTFDFGGDTPPSGLNAGNPNAGILAGTSATFVFANLSSTFASALDFLNDANSAGNSVAVRLQSVGANGNDSAKLGSFGGTLVTSGKPIPAPGAAALALIGIGLVSALRRRWA